MRAEGIASRSEAKGTAVVSIVRGQQVLGRKGGLLRFCSVARNVCYWNWIEVLVLQADFQSQTAAKSGRSTYSAFFVAGNFQWILGA